VAAGSRLQNLRAISGPLPDGQGLGPDNRFSALPLVSQVGCERLYGASLRAKRLDGLREPWEPIVFPEHALFIVEERLREQQAEGVRMPEGMALDELALRILIAAAVHDKR
jgi:hypothetical protein